MKISEIENLEIIFDAVKKLGVEIDGETDVFKKELMKRILKTLKINDEQKEFSQQF